MRILLAVPSDNDIGGVASVVGNLAEFLRSRGDEVFFLHPSSTILPKVKTTKLGFPGFDLRLQLPFGERHPLISILAFLFFFPIGLYQIVRLIRKYRIDVINLHYPADCLFYLALCSRILGVGLITSIHGADVFFDGKPKARYSRAFRFLLSSSDLIVAPSRQFQKAFLNVFPELAEKITFIHNGVNFTEISRFYSGCISKEQGGYILCISAYKEQKAIDVLIRAFKLVHEANPTAKLIIIGFGPLRRQMKELAVSLGIQEQIECLGPKGRAEVMRLLHGCEAFVLPSRFETFGIAVLEAMAFKKPVIATAVGAIPEIIENGTNGILVPPDHPEALGDALITVLNNRKLQLAIAAKGYATVHERYSAEKTGAAYEALFVDLLGGSIRCPT